jgi:hypothetical protein
MINVDFTGQFPLNGFYVVIKAFNTENLIFKRGDIVALKKYSNKNVRINLTGPQAAYGNYMRVDKMSNLRKLTPDEVSLLTNGAVIPDEAFTDNRSIEYSMTSLVEACRRIVKPRGFGVKKQILYIDNSSDWLKKIKELLQNEYDITTMNILEEAKTSYEQNDFSLVISAEKLKESFDGCEWLSTLRSLNKKVILLTSTHIPFHDCYLSQILKQKFNSDDFLSLVRKLLADDINRIPNCNINGQIPEYFKWCAGRPCFWICYSGYQIFVPYALTSEPKTAQQVCDQVCYLLNNLLLEKTKNPLCTFTEIQIDNETLIVNLLFSHNNILVKRNN